MNGKTAIVTGGGGPNIGSEISETLAKNGADVIIIDMKADRAKNTAKRIRQKGHDAVGFECDVTNIRDTENLISSLARERGRIDILVNNAGGASGVLIEEIDEEEFYYNINMNLKSAFFTTRATLPYLIENGDSSVVCVSSINVTVGGFSEIGYSVAKAGLHSLVKGLTADYGREKVRFNVVCAGSVIGNSDTWKRREKESPGTLERISDLYPLGRYGSPKDVANTVKFLCSDQASWISGVTIPVDGGLTATGNLPGGEWWENI